MMTLRAGMSRCPYFYKFRFINLWRFRKKRSKNRTRIARMTRIRADKKIRENPFDLCHPCSFPQQRGFAAGAHGEARGGEGGGVWGEGGGDWGEGAGGLHPNPASSGIIALIPSILLKCFLFLVTIAPIPVNIAAAPIRQSLSSISSPLFTRDE